MLNYAEDLLIKRRNKLRNQRVAKLVKNTHLKIPLRERSTFIESSIENDIRYFNHKSKFDHGLKGLASKKEDYDLEDVKMQVHKNEEILIKRD